MNDKRYCEAKTVLSHFPEFRGYSGMTFSSFEAPEGVYSSNTGILSKLRQLKSLFLVSEP